MNNDQNNQKLSKSQQYVLVGTVGALAGACVGALAGILMYDKDLRKKFQDGYENLRDMSYKMLDEMEEVKARRNKTSQKLLTDK